MDKKREEIIGIAKSWINTPYHPEARVKGAGCDCGTFLLSVFEEGGMIPHVELEHYAQDHHLNSARQDYLGWVKRFATEVEEPRPGDILLYTIGKCISHGALVIDYPLVIHSVQGHGVIYSDASQEIWKSRQTAVYSCFGGE